VASEHFGLIDTPPDRNEVRLSLTIIALLLASLLLIYPKRADQLSEFGLVIPLLDAFMLFSDLVIAALLYRQATVFRSRSLSILASGYVFSGLILIPHALTFPGAFSETGLLGAGFNTTAWLAIFRRIAFPLVVITYSLTRSAAPIEEPRPQARMWMLAAAVLAGLATLLATTGHDLLPPIFRDGRVPIPASLAIVNLATIVLTVSAILLIFRQDIAVLDLWLLVGLSAWLFQSLLNITLQSRYSVGWYGLNALTFASSLVLMVALIAETNRLYGRLALHAAAMDREREAGLMSVNAVTATMAHEVGQPVAAAGLSTAAALEWLIQEKPDLKKAIKSLRGALDANGRILKVVNSVRSSFSRTASPRTQFNVNDVVRASVALLEPDLTTRRVALKIDLEQAIPQITGNPDQLHRVLVNLLVNAIESVSATRGRTRRVEVRSRRLNDSEIIIEVQDSGVGIPNDINVQIFEPFFTTKGSGTGLGLWLSRNIIEQHGGRIWASPHQGHGATFHVHLPVRQKVRDLVS